MSSPDHQPIEVNQDTLSRKRSHPKWAEENTIQSGRSRISILDKPKEHSAAGSKRTFHATEMVTAEKFDDLVFQYDNERKDGIIYRFLQAKHNQDESKKISRIDLLTETNKKLSLQKYFISYRKIKQNPEFNGQNDELKDFVIYTNIDLRGNLQNSFEIVGDEDNIIDTDVQNNSKKPKRLKFRESDSLIKELTSIFQEASDLKRLANKLAEHVFSTNNNDKTINLRDDLFKKYHGALAEKVIDIQTKEFKIDFINENSNLSEEVKKFRKVLLEKSKLSEDDFKRELQTKNLKIPNKFGNVLKLEERLYRLPNDEVRIEEIDEFLGKLVLAVNQPNEVELGKIIKDEIGKEFNNSDKKNVYSRFLEKMLDWMKEKEGRFISYEDGKAFFEKIKKEILGAIWFDIKDQVKLFTGRKQELNDLHSKIQRSSEKPTVISRMTVIGGLGGMGKTQLARKYVYDHQKDYDGNVIWISAENHGTLENSFLNLARDYRVGISTKDKDGKEKTIETIVKEIYIFFASRKSLFIFDNAEKNEYLNKFLPLHSLTPNANKLYVLITSHNREWEKGIEVMDLNELKLEDAIAFVKTGLDIKDESQDQEIKTLVEKLQCFPLAIQQAIAYIEDQRVTVKFGIDDYIKEYEKKAEDLLRFEVFRTDNEIDNDYAKTTYTTWQITIDKIRSNEQYGQLALKILDTIAYFAPKSINREMFLDLAEGDRTKLKSAVRLLVKYSMVNGEQKQNVLSIHRLVQEVIRINLKNKDRKKEEEKKKEEEVLREALGLLRDNIDKCDVDHPISVWGYASSHHKLMGEFSNLPRRIVEKLCHDMKYSKAFSFEKEALESLMKLGDEHYEVAIMKRYMTNAHGGLGDCEKKRKLLEEEVLPILKEHYSDQSLEIARTLRNLGIAYGDLSDHEKEEKKKEELLESKKKYLEEALKFFKEYFKDDNIEVAKVKRNLANTYGDLGRHEEKRELLEEVLPIFEKNYGNDHLEVAKAKRDLANAHGELNNQKKKKEILENEVLPTILEKCCKSGYVEVEIEIEFAKTKRNLGNAYGKLGDHQKKMELLEEALPIFERYNHHLITELRKALDKLGSLQQEDEVSAEECLPSTSHPW